MIAAYAFARYLARPLTELRAAVERVGRGETPPPLPESGPSEIAAVNHRFNAMIPSPLLPAPSGLDHFRLQLVVSARPANPFGLLLQSPEESIRITENLF